MIKITPEYLAEQDLSPTIVQRFWEHINRTDSCWLFNGAPDHKGYGRLVNYHIIGTKRCTKIFAHRLSWLIFIGPIPDGLFVLHKCDVPLCVNWEHLFLGTQLDNMRDKVSKGRGATGERNGQARLTTEQVLEIRRLYRRYSHVHNINSLAKQFGVSDAAVQRVVTRTNWNQPSHLGPGDSNVAASRPNEGNVARRNSPDTEGAQLRIHFDD